MKIRHLQRKRPGIYCIANVETETYYIGSSIDMRARLSAHRKSLELGTHSNTILQRDWKRYSQHAFQARVLEECTIDNLREREQYWIDRLVNSGKGCYNRSLKASRNGGHHNLQMSSVVVYRNLYNGACIVVPFVDGLANPEDLRKRAECGAIQNKQFNRDKRGVGVVVERCVVCTFASLRRTITQIETELRNAGEVLYQTPKLPRNLVRKYSHLQEVS